MAASKELFSLTLQIDVLPEDVIQIAEAAGRVILEIYNGLERYGVE